MPPGPNYSSTADEDSNLDTSALNRSPHLFQGAAVSQQIITQMSLSSPHRTSTTGGYSTTSRKSLSPQTSSFSLPDSPTEPLAHRLSIGIMYGLINAAVVLPVMMSFGTIIYHDEAFSPYLPTLIKLTLVSSVVHQLCFSYWSSLPYSIGQVQDAGLIFLSAMSTMISTYTKDRGYDDEHMLATATIGLSLCTAVLGIGLMIIGKARLASYVQMLPTAVVGGYLAFIGWFCGQSGVGLMAGVEITHIWDWHLILTKHRLMLTVPGILGGLFVYTAARKLRHMAVLPMCMLAIIGLFYTAMYATGTTVDEAREFGWITAADPSGPWQETWKFMRFDKVVWSALPQLTVTLISMTMVVALSSSLDIAAIELELNQKLDYDNELMTVGLSNFLSGCTGGYTGSYIFSQTIFTLRSGVRDRFTGYTVAFCEMLIVVAPVPVIAYIPKLFFGSLLVMICTDLMFEWLWQVREKLSGAEYCVCLGTFLIIMFIGVEWGILAGIVLDWGVRKWEGKKDGNEEEKEQLVEGFVGA